VFLLPDRSLQSSHTPRRCTVSSLASSHGENNLPENGCKLYLYRTISNWSRLFLHYLLNRPMGSTFCVCMDHGCSSLWTEIKGDRSRDMVSKDGNVVGLTLIFDREQFV